VEENNYVKAASIFHRLCDFRHVSAAAAPQHDRFIFVRQNKPAIRLTIGKNKAKIYVDDAVKIRFTNAAGVGEAKQELEMAMKRYLTSHMPSI
jgi:hypothetical protein